MVPDLVVQLGEVGERGTRAKQCVVAAVIRGEDFVVPRGDTRIEAGDRVIFVGPASAVKAARDVIHLKR